MKEEAIARKMAVERYDIEADVVVIGYGGAGANATITAHDNGADVLILEKMASGGGNTRVCGGAITTPSAKEFLQYLERLNYGYTEPEIIERHVEEALKNPDWVRELGGNLVKRVYLRRNNLRNYLEVDLWELEERIDE